MKVMCAKTGGCHLTDNVVSDDCRDVIHCRYYTRTGLAEGIDWREAFSNMAAAFEELAGEHNALMFALQSPSGVVCSMPLVADGEVAVKPYKRSKPRRSKFVKTEAVPSEDTDTGGNGQSGASGEAQGASWWCCNADYGEHDTTCPNYNPPQSPESADPGPTGGTDGIWAPGMVVPEGITVWQCEDCGQAVSRLEHECLSPEPEDVLREEAA